MEIGRWVAMVLAGIRAGGIGWELNRRSQSNDRIFPISYEAARIMVIKSGKLVGVKIRPHDLRRHSAAYASRSGIPIEIISKVILRHANLSTTQRYPGTISDIEVIRWIENIIWLKGRGEADCQLHPTQTCQ